jgi:methylsterol monooxygenase
MQPNENRELDWSKIRHVTAVVLFNQIFISLAVTALIYPLFRWSGCSVSIATFPSFNRFIFDLLICLFVEEFFFYYLHRLFHSRILYRLFHRVHHEFTSPIAVGALYAHPGKPKAKC